MLPLLQQDVYFLSIKWFNPLHIPSDESLTPKAWRNKYRENLEVAIGEWLADALIAYQHPRWPECAFLPISHLVGTSRESISYTESLVALSSALEYIPAPYYKPHPTKFSENNAVLLGECFGNGIAQASVNLAKRLIADKVGRNKYFRALIDSLYLIQAVKPSKAEKAMCSVWSELNQSKEILADLTKLYPWEVVHRLILAIYSVCHVASGSEIRNLIQQLDVLVKEGGAPSIVMSDLKACFDLVFSKAYEGEDIYMPSRIASKNYKVEDLRGIYAARSPAGDLAPKVEYPQDTEFDYA